MDFYFDLDGTLSDPAVGITRSIQHALAAMGGPALATAELTRFIGPPLRKTFAELLVTAETSIIEAAVAAYRVRFAEVGLYENVLYDGIVEALRALSDAGHRAWVVTSKPHVYATRIVEHFGLARWFEGVFGSELSGANTDKRDLIRLALAGTGARPSDVVMIGDRGADMEGARANAVGAVAVTWGYGSREELIAVAPDRLLDTRAELARLVSAAR